MSDGGEPLGLWVVLGALAVGPIYAAIVVYLRQAVTVDALLAVCERLLRAGEQERFTKLLAAITQTSRASPV